VDARHEDGASRNEPSLEGLEAGRVLLEHRTHVHLLDSIVVLLKSSPRGGGILHFDAMDSTAVEGTRILLKRCSHRGKVIIGTVGRQKHIVKHIVKPPSWLRCSYLRATDCGTFIALCPPHTRTIDVFFAGSSVDSPPGGSTLFVCFDPCDCVLVPAYVNVFISLLCG